MTINTVTRGKTEYDVFKEEMAAARAKRLGLEDPGQKSSRSGVGSASDRNQRNGNNNDPNFYYDLKAARYQKLYRMCLIIQKKNSVEKLKTFRLLKKYGTFDFFDIPFFAENEAFIMREGLLEVEELKTEEQVNQEAWYLSVFQFIIYKTYQRVRIALMKLIKHKGERRVAQIAAFFKKFKRIGAKRIISIYSECNHTKLKAEVMAQWKRSLRVMEIEEAMK